jgi:2-amino-4-hydroxy-6-hydroxymethyldihydropteridine diphosphokinase
MTTVYLALGSNVGDSRRYISDAIAQLGDNVSDIRQAPLYKSKAVGYTDQPDFLNTAISGQTALSPPELLVRIKAIEKQLGRIERFRWGPREIDIDIIFYGDTVLETEELTVPHPAFRDRVFVLQPLHDLDPKLIDPISGQTVGQLLDKLGQEQQSGLQIVDQTA